MSEKIIKSACRACHSTVMDELGYDPLPGYVDPEPPGATPS